MDLFWHERIEIEKGILVVEQYFVSFLLWQLKWLVLCQILEGSLYDFKLIFICSSTVLLVVELAPQNAYAVICFFSNMSDACFHDPSFLVLFSCPENPAFKKKWLNYIVSMIFWPKYFNMISISLWFSF